MIPNNFKVSINRFDSLLEEKTNSKFEIEIDDSDKSVKFKGVYEGIEVLLKIARTNFMEDNTPVKWKYCADPKTDYWVTRNSNDLVSLTSDFHTILKNKMFDPQYLATLKKEDK